MMWKTDRAESRPDTWERDLSSQRATGHFHGDRVPARDGLPRVGAAPVPVCRGFETFVCRSEESIRLDSRRRATGPNGADPRANCRNCLLYTSDAADERSSVDLGGRRI